MPIEFICQVCKQQIRVPDGNEGKRTKCPHCSAIQPIPGGTNQGESSFGGSSSSDSLFSDSDTGGQQPPNPFAEGSNRPPIDESNPYASPYSASLNPSQTIGFEEAKGKLAVPAIVCMAFAGLCTALILFGIVANIVMLAVDGGNGGNEIPGLIGNLIGTSISLLFNVSCLYTLYNGSQLRSHSQAWAGFILAMLPCTTSLCCILVIPFAIWGMVVLSDAEVKRQFQG